MNRGILAAVAAAVVATASLRASGYDSMRIMSFNICHCAAHYWLSVTDEDVRRTASVIAAESPDFVCLQEVDDKTTRSDGIDETARLAELTGMYGTFGKALDYKDGGYGVAILSKEAPLSSWTVPLPRTSPTNSDEVIGYEPRVLLICEFTNLCVATSHFDLYPAHQAAYLPTVLAALKECAKPVFITGDWNATPDSETLAAMREFVTIVSPESGVRTLGDFEGDDYVIDYIAVDTADADKYYVQRGYCVSNVVDGHGSSDHNPVIVDVVRRSDAPGWVEENAVMTGRTGTWSPAVAWNGGTWTADLGGGYAFEPVTPSGGNVVTMTAVMTFDCVPMEESRPKEGAQGGLCLGMNGCFQVWTRLRQGSGGQAGWVDVEADGVTPQVGVEYTLRFTFDYRYGTYSAEVQNGGGEWVRFVERGNPVRKSFPLASPASRISRVRFDGSGVFRSLLGEWAQKVNAFMMRIF